MSFVRPEARAALWRWREALTGGALGALGLCWLVAGAGPLAWLGGALALAGGALIVAGLQRARFRGAAGGGAGMVEVDEGRIAYFGPFTGGVVALSEMSALTLDRRRCPAHWVLSQPGRPDLVIPVDGEGAEALFDVFASLPGLRTEAMLRALHAADERPVEIWRRHAPVSVRLAPTPPH